MVSVWRTRENGMSEPTPAAAVPETVVAFAIVALTVAGPSDASYSNAKTHRAKQCQLSRTEPANMDRAASGELIAGVYVCVPA